MSNQVSWFHVPRPIARPRVRLFCFPHAGGSATVFHRWPPLLGDDIEVLAAQLPGRGARLRERPYRRMVELIPALVEVIRPRLDVPYAVFGHSLGAATAFGLVLALRRAGAPLPASLFVSACPAPQLERELRPIHPLPQAAFLQALEERYGIADGTLRDPDLAALLYPALQADMEVLETWAYQAEDPLPVPLTACVGASDLTVTRDALDAWRAQSSESFTLHLLNGDHFYLLSNPPPLVRLLRDALAGVGC
jgi:medium-chain acyl-[acyl-carrier-protein] hydrolase